MKTFFRGAKAHACYALLLGIVLTFSFAPYGIFPLAILAPAGLMALWLNVSPKRAFWLGFLFGIGLFGAGVYWVYISIHIVGGVPLIISSLITAGLIAILALFPAFVGFCFAKFFTVQKNTPLLLGFPALWVTSEWIRSWLFTGFPWLFLGYSQTDSPLRGFAPFLSVYGVSFAVALCSAFLVVAISNYQQKKYGRVYLCVLGIIGLFTAGSLFTLIHWTQPKGKVFRVALVQGNIAQVMKWSPEYLQNSIDRYQTLAQPLWQKTDLIIWPETAIPLPLQNAADTINQLDNKALATHTALLLGIPMQAIEAQGYYNAIVTLGEDKNLYTKRHLVPFGEYTPFLHVLSNFFNSMNIPVSDIIAGEMKQPFMTINHTKIMAAICYEIAFPELMYTNDQNLGMIITITNDAWFGRSNAQAQHLQMAAMRAIELARPLIFVSNDGITALIAPDGKITNTAPPHTAYVLQGTVQPVVGITPWMLLAMDPIVLILIISYLAAGRVAFVAKRAKTKK